MCLRDGEDEAIEQLLVAAEKVVRHSSGGNVSKHRFGCPPWSSGATCQCGINDVAHAIERVRSPEVS